MTDSVQIKRALVSCSDKTGLESLCKLLHSFHVEIIASGGTATSLKEWGIPHTSVEDITQWPEMLGGRVKTLHPKIHGGILHRRHDPEDQKAVQEHQIPSIDIVIVNLYPFETKPSIEMIDVGGPTLLRGAAKNHASVVVLSSPNLYAEFEEEFRQQKGCTRLAFRHKCAAETFKRTSAYDVHISQWFHQEPSQTLTLSVPKAHSLRYGENPQQSASVYYPGGNYPFQVHQGKELSYNNLCDLQSAIEIVYSANAYFADKRHYCVVIKHQNPCGFGAGTSSQESWENAVSGDPEAAFGGIVACSQTIGRETAEKMANLFLECIVAPDFEPNALTIFSAKKNLRLITLKEIPAVKNQLRSWFNGVLLQSQDSFEPVADWNVNVTRAPTKEQMKAAQVAWYICRYIKSNAVAIASEDRLIAAGAGQMSRVDAIRILERKLKALKPAPDMKLMAVASDAFFPFKDSIETLATLGVQCIIQPGGSVRDQEVIESCRQHGISLIVTGRRHFYH